MRSFRPEPFPEYSGSAPVLPYLPYILYAAIQIFRIRMMRIHFVINKRNVERFELLNIYLTIIIFFLHFSTAFKSTNV